jgi:uncharacterized protein with HEPN domain
MPSLSETTTLNLQVLIEAIDKISLYTKDIDNADDFYHDQKSFDACMMQFVVIGETISRLDASFKEEHTTIPWQKIKNFRNIVAHDYFGIDPEEIWDIMTNKLLPLKNDISDLMDEMKSNF